MAAATPDPEQSGLGWHGVDLDGTLATQDGWTPPDHIGDPVPRMQARVLAWIAAGEEVRVVTARADDTYPAEYAAFMRAWPAWSLRHLGVVLPVTNRKDYRMIDLWDDRAVGVVFNTGLRADGLDDLVTDAA